MAAAIPWQPADAAKRRRRGRVVGVVGGPAHPGGGARSALALAEERAAKAMLPMLVLDHGHNPTAHQARCRLCRWKSTWCEAAPAARAEHARHLAGAHTGGGEAA